MVHLDLDYKLTYCFFFFPTICRSHMSHLIFLFSLYFLSTEISTKNFHQKLKKFIKRMHIVPLTLASYLYLVLLFFNFYHSNVLENHYSFELCLLNPIHCLDIIFVRLVVLHKETTYCF